MACPEGRRRNPELEFSRQEPGNTPALALEQVEVITRVEVTGLCAGKQQGWGGGTSLPDANELAALPCPLPGVLVKVSMQAL